jgi:hypothetical protein
MLARRRHRLTIARRNPMATVKTYDRRCYDLAAIFLGDEPDLHTESNIHALALEIQQCIEDEIYFMRNEAALSPRDQS